MKTINVFFATAILLFAIALQVRLVTANTQFVVMTASCDDVEIPDMARAAPDAPISDIAKTHR